MSASVGDFKRAGWLGLFLIASALNLFAQSSAQNPLAPPLPPFKCPVEQFRQMLAMNAAEREQNLANRSPELKNRLLEKLAEYDHLPSDVRETRLRMTQIRWYMLALIQIPVTNRNTYLTQIPDGDRAVVASRLAQWSRLPAETQTEVLKYEKTMEHFRGQNVEGTEATNRLIEKIPLASQPDALKDLDSFLQLPSDRRQQLYSSFQHFFELSGDDQQRTLALLPPVIQPNTNSLALLAKLPREQRLECLKALAKFSALNPLERNEFRRNAERWNELSPLERDAWRSLVIHVQPSPPVPPGLIFPPMPPMPTVQASTAK